MVEGFGDFRGQDLVVYGLGGIGGLNTMVLLLSESGMRMRSRSPPGASGRCSYHGLCAFHVDKLTKDAEMVQNPKPRDFDRDEWTPTAVCSMRYWSCRHGPRATLFNSSLVGVVSKSRHF